MEAAPLYNDVAEGPADGAGYWLTADDGLRIRMAVWPSGSKGTVFIFPGRTEYAEKYGRAAQDLGARGYATLAIDWRGQGLAERMLDDSSIGHVMRFQDYQHDVAAVLDAARQLELPHPWFVIAHSMGGCIGLRTVMEGADFEACAFTAPMWGVQMSTVLSPVAWTLSTVLPPLGFGNMRSPGTRDAVYVLDAPFEDNTLTNDREMWDYMVRQAHAHRALGLASPSIVWLREALREMRGLSLRPSPATPCICFLGTNERIVDPGRIHARMAAWPGGRLVEFPDAEHEVMMEEPPVRDRVFTDAVAHFEAAVGKQAA